MRLLSFVMFVRNKNIFLIFSETGFFKVVAHEILVSASGPLVLGFWVWGLGVWGLGLTIGKIEASRSPAVLTIGWSLSGENL